MPKEKFNTSKETVNIGTIKEFNQKEYDKEYAIRYKELMSLPQELLAKLIIYLEAEIELYKESK